MDVNVDENLEGRLTFSKTIVVGSLRGPGSSSPYHKKGGGKILRAGGRADAQHKEGYRHCDPGTHELTVAPVVCPRVGSTVHHRYGMWEGPRGPAFPGVIGCSQWLLEEMPLINCPYSSKWLLPIYTLVKGALVNSVGHTQEGNLKLGGGLGRTRFQHEKERVEIGEGVCVKMTEIYLIHVLTMKEL